MRNGVWTVLACSWYPTKFKIEIASQCKIRQFLSHVKTNLRAALLSSKKASNCWLQNSQLNLCWFFVHFFFENWLQKMVTVQLSACNLWYKCTEKYFMKNLTLFQCYILVAFRAGIHKNTMTIIRRNVHSI